MVLHADLAKDYIQVVELLQKCILYVVWKKNTKKKIILICFIYSYNCALQHFIVNYIILFFKMGCKNVYHYQKIIYINLLYFI